MPMQESLDILAKVPMSMVNAAAAMSGRLTPIGLPLLTIAFLAELTKQGFSWFMSSDVEKILGGLFRLIVVTAIPLYVLKHWGDASGLIPHFFQNKVTSAIAGTGNPADLFSSLMTIIDNFWKQMMSNLFDFKPQQTIGATSWYGKAWNTAVDAVSNSLPAQWIQGVIGLLAQMIIFIIFTIFVGIPILIFGVLLMGTLYGTQILTYVGVLFGPIMICWLPWAPMAWLTQSWIKHMITMGMTYAVAVAITEICRAGIIQVVASLEGPVSNDPFSAVGAIVAVYPICLLLGLTILFMCYLLHRAEDFASAITSGGGSGSGIGVTSSAMRMMRMLPKGKR